MAQTAGFQFGPCKISEYIINGKQFWRCMIAVDVRI